VGSFFEKVFRDTISNAGIYVYGGHNNCTISVRNKNDGFYSIIYLKISNFEPHNLTYLAQNQVIIIAYC